MFYALIPISEYVNVRQKLRHTILASKNEKEFLCRIDDDQELPNCEILSSAEKDHYIAITREWGGEPEEDDLDLVSMKKSELIALAEEWEVELPVKATKAQIIALLKED